MSDTIRILAFGVIAEVIGRNELQWTASHDTDSLRVALQQTYRELVDKKFAIAVNECLVHDNTALREGDTVALLPPFSGG